MHAQLFWAQMHGLSSDEVLFAFGRHYRDLEPSGTSHQNIRAIISNGLDGVRFSAPPLSLKQGVAEGLPSWAVARTGMLDSTVLQLQLYRVDSRAIWASGYVEGLGLVVMPLKAVCVHVRAFVFVRVWMCIIIFRTN